MATVTLPKLRKIPKGSRLTVLHPIAFVAWVFVFLFLYRAFKAGARTSVSEFMVIELVLSLLFVILFVYVFPMYDDRDIRMLKQSNKWLFSDNYLRSVAVYCTLLAIAIAVALIGSESAFNAYTLLSWVPYVQGGLVGLMLFYRRTAHNPISVFYEEPEYLEN